MQKVAIVELSICFMHPTELLRESFQIKMDQNCSFEVIHTKPLHQHYSRKADGSDMQNIMEGIFYC